MIAGPCPEFKLAKNVTKLIRLFKWSLFYQSSKSLTQKNATKGKYRMRLARCTVTDSHFQWCFIFCSVLSHLYKSLVSFIYMCAAAAAAKKEKHLYRINEIKEIRSFDFERVISVFRLNLSIFVYNVLSFFPKIHCQNKNML